MHQCMYGAVTPINTAYNDAFSSHARGHTYVAVCPCAREENANLLKAGNRALDCWVYDAMCTTSPAAHQPPLQ